MSHPDIQSGTYRARGVTAMLGTANTGTEQVAVQLVFVGGPYDGKHITWYGFFTEKTTERTLDSLRNLGWQGDELWNLEGIDSQDVDIVIENDTNKEGEVRSKVRWINAISGPALKNQMTPEEAKAFSARMKGTVAAHRKGAGVPRDNGAKRAEQPPPHRDDDIPF